MPVLHLDYLDMINTTNPSLLPPLDNNATKVMVHLMTLIMSSLATPTNLPTHVNTTALTHPTHPNTAPNTLVPIPGTELFSPSKGKHAKMSPLPVLSAQHHNLNKHTGYTRTVPLGRQ